MFFSKEFSLFEMLVVAGLCLTLGVLPVILWIFLAVFLGTLALFIRS